MSHRIVPSLVRAFAAALASHAGGSPPTATCLPHPGQDVVRRAVALGLSYGRARRAKDQDAAESARWTYLAFRTSAERVGIARSLADECFTLGARTGYRAPR